VKWRLRPHKPGATTFLSAEMSTSSPPSIATPTAVAGLHDADLLFDAARLVALNGFAHECRLLPFLSPDYAREEDFLVATRHVRYGPACGVCCVWARRSGRGT
jgi:hypothetical protein